jgi:hypothetical protein
MRELAMQHKTEAAANSHGKAASASCVCLMLLCKTVRAYHCNAMNPNTHNSANQIHIENKSPQKLAFNEFSILFFSLIGVIYGLESFCSRTEEWGTFLTVKHFSNFPKIVCFHPRENKRDDK